MAPVESEGRSSVLGVQVGLGLVALVLRQIPPFTVPITTISALVGCAAMASTAPATGRSTGVEMFSTCPPVIGPGPCSTQVGIRETVKASDAPTARALPATSTMPE